jgi:hypothetical protein
MANCENIAQGTHLWKEATKNVMFFAATEDSCPMILKHYLEQCM